MRIRINLKKGLRATPERIKAIETKFGGKHTKTIRFKDHDRLILSAKDE